MYHNFIFEIRVLLSAFCLAKSIETCSKKEAWPKCQSDVIITGIVWTIELDKWMMNGCWSTICACEANSQLNKAHFHPLSSGFHCNCELVPSVGSKNGYVDTQIHTHVYVWLGPEIFAYYMHFVSADVIKCISYMPLNWVLVHPFVFCYCLHFVFAFHYLQHMARICLLILGN